MTILLYTWVVTQVNVPSPKDKWLGKLLDKLYISFMGLLGPDLLGVLALIQWSEAWRGVKVRNPVLGTRFGQDGLLVAS